MNLRSVRSTLLFSIILLLPLVGMAQIPTKGLVGYWPFNGNANDESVNSNHGKVTNAVLTSDRFGRKDSAYYFDGNGDYITVKRHATLLSSEHSINFWFQIAQADKGSYVVVSNRNSVNGEWGSAVVL